MKLSFDYTLDTSRVREQLLQFHSQFSDASSATFRSFDNFNPIFDKIILLGFGVSGIACRMMRDYLASLQLRIPVILHTDSTISEYENALVFVLSYSGQTDETIECYRTLAKKKNVCVVISSGGRLETVSQMYKSIYIKLDSGIPSYLALGHLLTPLWYALVKAKVIVQEKAVIPQVIESLQKDFYEDFAKELAFTISHRVPLIYSTSQMSSISYAWAFYLRKMASALSFSQTVPQAIYDDIDMLGSQSFSSTLTPDLFYAITLKDIGDESKTKRKLELFKEHFKSKQVQTIEVVLRGEHTFVRIISFVYLGMWVSYYLALLRRVNLNKNFESEFFKSRIK
jgi:glucose/mannose-6-phosphate isomerase